MPSGEIFTLIAADFHNYANKKRRTLVLLFTIVCYAWFDDGSKIITNYAGKTAPYPLHLCPAYSPARCLWKRMYRILYDLYRKPW